MTVEIHQDFLNKRFAPLEGCGTVVGDGQTSSRDLLEHLLQIHKTMAQTPLVAGVNRHPKPISVTALHPSQSLLDSFWDQVHIGLVPSSRAVIEIARLEVRPFRTLLFAYLLRHSLLCRSDLYTMN